MSGRKNEETVLGVLHQNPQDRLLVLSGAIYFRFSALTIPRFRFCEKSRSSLLPL